MNYKTHKIALLLMLIFCSASSFAVGKINPGKYILVSFSMNDQALKDYFIEAQKHGAVPVFQGVISDGKDGRLKKLSGHVPLLPALQKMGEV